MLQRPRVSRGEEVGVQLLKRPRVSRGEEGYSCYKDLGYQEGRRWGYSCYKAGLILRTHYGTLAPAFPQFLVFFSEKFIL